MASSPMVEGNNVVSFAITSNGSEIPSTYGVTSVTVNQGINKIAEAQLTVRDGNPAAQVFEITDSSVFEPGAAIEISIGYNTENEVIFSGIVTRQSIRSDDSGTTLQVTCKDEIIKITKSRSNLMLSDSLDSDAIEQIASTAGISETDITATTVTQDNIVQYNTPDWDFVVNRAELNGMVVVTDAGKLVVAAPPVDDEAVLTLTYGFDIYELDTELDATNQAESVEWNSWDIDSQALVTTTASDPTVNDQGDLSSSTLDDVMSVTNTVNTSVPVSAEDAQVWADASLLKSRLSRFTGNVSFQGSSLVKPNTMIELAGLGERFDGNAYVSTVNHNIGNGTWKTSINIGMSPEWFSEKPEVAKGPENTGRLKGITGLQTGIVKSVYDADETEFRVQVQIPVLNNETEMIWARLATFYASNTFGAFFYPEVDDEVIVGFMNDDPRYPIILGSVYSSSIPPPVTIEDANNYTKALYTKSQLQMSFDDENIVMTFLTPNGNTIVISDQDEGITVTDQNSNQIQMNGDGITIQSQSSMTIQATNDLTIQGSSVTIKSDNALSQSGGSISISADQSTSISGSSGCDMSSSGEINIAGSMVNLNS